jgi:hypothetical protein
MSKLINNQPINLLLTNYLYPITIYNIQYTIYIIYNIQYTIYDIRYIDSNCIKFMKIVTMYC